jgi:16S rRNA pseudouridine516 synthase
MFEYINNKVIYLKRVEVNNIRLDENLKLGEYKEIDLD